jgi:hypothetical protein
MTLVGWGQIALTLALVLLCALPLGRFMAPGLARLCGRRPMLAFNACGLRAALRDPAVPGPPAAQSAGLRRRCRGRPRVQHRGQLRHQHQLAVLWRRDDDEPFQPDGRADGAELRLRGHGMALAVALTRGLRALGGGRRSAISGPTDPRHALRAAAARDRHRARLRRARACRRRSTRSVTATTLEGAKQTIALGPVASQEAIKQLGTNGGGFFNVNAAHPFENPNASPTISIWRCWRSRGLLLHLRRMVGDRAGLGAVRGDVPVLIAGVGASTIGPRPPAIRSTALGVDAAGNMEGKEVRFGQAARRALWAP